jgi:hypothetical protein
MSPAGFEPKIPASERSQTARPLGWVQKVILSRTGPQRIKCAHYETYVTEESCKELFQSLGLKQYPNYAKATT